MPSGERVGDRAPGSQRAAAVSASSRDDGDAVSTMTPRRPGAARSRVRALPAVVSISACASPRKPSASRQRGGAGGPGVSGLEAAGDDQYLADEERRGWQAGERAE